MARIQAKRCGRKPPSQRKERINPKEMRACAEEALVKRGAPSRRWTSEYAGKRPMKEEQRSANDGGKGSARPLIDCPRCGAKPPTAHVLGGGPGFEGIRTCGRGCGTWDDTDLPAWRSIYLSAGSPPSL